MRIPLTTLLFLLCGLTATAQLQLMPLADVRPGMKGTGRTVFSGGTVEEFQAEILGILENAGPKQSIILARLSGGPLEQTGVLQGMSGSPVYIDGKLIGAVALSFAFSKEPIAGIRPIDEMLDTASALPSQHPHQGQAAPCRSEPSSRPAPRNYSKSPRPSGWPDSAAPPSTTSATHSAPPVSNPSRAPAAAVNPPRNTTGRRPQPGEMISVQLMTGDLSVGADGTVTHVDGDRLWAFGHRFLAVGDTAMPFARAEVMTLLANQNLSFKISTPKEWMGSIRQDRSSAIAGRIGEKVSMIPLKLSLQREGGARAALLSNGDGPRPPLRPAPPPDGPLLRRRRHRTHRRRRRGHSQSARRRRRRPAPHLDQHLLRRTRRSAVDGRALLPRPSPP